MNSGARQIASIIAKPDRGHFRRRLVGERSPAPRTPAAPANDALARKSRRHWMICIEASSVQSEARAPDCSCLQLALELVEEAPVGALGDELVGGGRDHPRLVQPERIEPQRVLGVVLAPAVVREVRQRLKRVIIPRGESPIDQTSRGPSGSAAQKSTALRMARNTRLVATGCSG